MLRRADNASLTYRARMFGKVDLVFAVGKTKQFVIARKVPRSEVQVWQDGQREYPRSVALPSLGRTYWNFVDRWWWDNDGLSAEQVHALLVTQLQRQQARIERAQAVVAMGAEPRPVQRGQIPDDVKQFVWQRDQGACRNCGATVELQFDHVIPVALGGSSDAENLQILCGPCNRRKSAGITIR